MSRAQEIIELFGGASSITPTSSYGGVVYFRDQVNIDGHKIEMRLDYNLYKKHKIEIDFSTDANLGKVDVGPKVALQIFSVVAKNLRGVINYLGLENVRGFTFSGALEESSRIKAYNRMAGILAKEYNGKWSYQDKRDARWYDIQL